MEVCTFLGAMSVQGDEEHKIATFLNLPETAYFVVIIKIKTKWTKRGEKGIQTQHTQANESNKKM